MEERKLLVSYVYPNGFGRAFFVVNGLITQATIIEIEERIKGDLVAEGSMKSTGRVTVLSYQILESAE